MRPGLSLLALMLASTSAPAARYDPDADRAALRGAATAAYATVVDAAGLALEPAKAPAISAGLDEGLRQARAAADAARSLELAARRRGEEMEAGVKEGLERRLEEAAAPVAVERRRWSRLSGEHEALGRKAEALPEEARKKLRPALAAAEASLRAADDALNGAQSAIGEMGSRVPALRSAARDAARSSVELFSGSSATVVRAEELGALMPKAKERLGALGQEPLDVSRRRAWEALDPLRDATRLLFEGADRACNRADDLRRASAAYERASGAVDEAATKALAGRSKARGSLDEADSALARVREAVR